jgi:hypothetical protein
MRVKCPCCRCKFDVPIRVVMTEAARIAERSPKNISPPAAGSEPDGNLLSPHDLEGRKLRDDAIARRTKS